jgi:hypothetical protein
MNKFNNSYSDALYIVKSDLKKAFLNKLSNYLLIIFLGLLALTVIGYTVGFDIFTLPFESFDIKIDLRLIARFAGAFVVVALFFISIISVLPYSSSKFVFFKNHVEIFQTSLIGLTESYSVDCDNITRVWFEQEGVFSKIYRTGTIFLDFTGINRKDGKISFVSHPETAVEFIQKMIPKKQTSYRRFAF